MNLEEIKLAISNGQTVYLGNIGYQVVLDSKGNYLIKHHSGSCIGLTWADDTTLNGKQSEFFIKTIY